MEHLDVLELPNIGRSLQDLLAFLQHLHTLKIDLFLHQQALDTTTPAGKAMFQMLGVVAEFERAIIIERINSGIEPVQFQVRTGSARASRRRRSAWL
jgi:DNA invertase Pin-like site-specific DNA recombinase